MAQGRGPGGPFMRGYMTDEEKVSQPRVTRALLKRIFSYLRPYSGKLALVLVCIAAASFFTLLPSILTGKIIDEGLVKLDLRALVKYIVLSLAVTLGANLIGVAESYINTWIAQHMKVLDIKQASERSIVFYQSQIAAAIKKFPTIHTEQAVSSGAKKLTSLFRNYRMALYLFGFSSFLESLLLENFREDYLNQVADKVQQYNVHYQNQFSKCRDVIKSYSSGSVEKQVLGSIGNASKALGKLIAASPVLSKGPVDEWLQDGGDKLLQGNIAGTERAAAILDAENNIGNEMYVDSIRSIESICNHTTGILFDADAIYIAAS